MGLGTSPGLEAGQLLLIVLLDSPVFSLRSDFLALITFLKSFEKDRRKEGMEKMKNGQMEGVGEDQSCRLALLVLQSRD